MMAAGRGGTLTRAHRKVIMCVNIYNMRMRGRPRLTQLATLIHYRPCDRKRDTPSASTRYKGATGGVPSGPHASAPIHLAHVISFVLGNTRIASHCRLMNLSSAEQSRCEARVNERGGGCWMQRQESRPGPLCKRHCARVRLTQKRGFMRSFHICARISGSCQTLTPRRSSR